MPDLSVAIATLKTTTHIALSSPRHSSYLITRWWSSRGDCKDRPSLLGLKINQFQSQTLPTVKKYSDA